MNAAGARHCIECAERIDPERASNPRVMNCEECAADWFKAQHTPKRRIVPFSFTRLPRRDFVPRRMA